MRPKVYAYTAMSPHLTFRRTEDETGTDVGYMRADGHYAAVRIGDTSDAPTIAKQLQVLAEMMTRSTWAEGLAKGSATRRE